MMGGGLASWTGDEGDPGDEAVGAAPKPGSARPVDGGEIVRLSIELRRAERAYAGVESVADARAAWRAAVDSRL